MLRHEPEYNAADLADALESAALAFLRIPPVRQALDDLLRTYGLTAQYTELIGNLHDQVQALAELQTLVYARLIEHDRRAIEVSKNTQTIMQRQETRMQVQDGLPDTILQAANDALDRLHAEAAAQIAALEVEAQRARELLRTERHAARAVMSEEATAAREKLHEESDASSA